ncbi:MAG: HDOD domain-containing protein [Gemmatimonadales bacterium]|nr:HDOD domain-containing protein [Gemmatimonadales bacterium]
MPPSEPPEGPDADAVGAGGAAAFETLLAGRVATLVEVVRAQAEADGAPDVAALAVAIGAAPVEQIRQFPAAAQRALVLTEREDVAVAEIVALCEGDPALAQAVLRQASSALYGGAPCASLREAVLRLGAGGTRNAVLQVVVSGLLCRPGSDVAGMLDQCWAHMTRTAPLASRLAGAFAAPPDDAFAAALLHDVGKLIVFDRATQLRGEWRRDLALPGAPFAALLRALHEPLGGLAALRWGLGIDTARAIAGHHRHPAPERRDAIGEAVHLAERLDLAAQRGVPLDLAEVWATGRLTGSAARVAHVLARAA